MTSETSARALIAEITARPGQADRVRSMLDQYAKIVRGEAGNVTFVVHQREADPAQFLVYEVYSNVAAFETHITATYGAEFNRKLAPLIEEPEAKLSFLTPP